VSGTSSCTSRTLFNEYIDERFPAIPADAWRPGDARARARLMLFNMEAELFSQIRELSPGKEKQVERVRQHVTDRLIRAGAGVHQDQAHARDDFTMLDVAIARSCGGWTTTASSSARPPRRS